MENMNHIGAQHAGTHIFLNLMHMMDLPRHMRMKPI